MGIETHNKMETNGAQTPLPHALLNALQEVIFALDADYCVTYINPAVSTVLPLTVDQAMGHCCYELFFGRDACCEGCPVTRSAAKHQASVSYETMLNNKVVEIDCFIQFEHGRFSGASGSLREVSRKKLDERRRLCQDRLFALGELAASIAHDYKNQLMVIRGNASLIKSICDDPNITNYAQHILHTCQNANILTYRLLKFSKNSESDVFCNLNELIESLYDIVRLCVGSAVELTLRCNAINATVKIDKCRMENLLINLASNARDAMPHGGRLTIETYNAEACLNFDYDFRNEEDSGKYVALVVEDTGEGIDPSIKHKVFEPFYSTKKEGLGTGLGLPSVLKTIEAYHGVLKVESDVRAGTRFIVFLPIVGI